MGRDVGGFPRGGEGDAYLSVRDGPEAGLRVRGSRFLARAFALGGPEERSCALEAVVRRHQDATHHCWALRSGHPEGSRELWDDAGEPSGSAGRPILGALQAAAVSDALVVVSRWFGGMKLGTGGLARAYAAAAGRALGAAERRCVWRTTRLRVRVGYEDLGCVEGVLARAGDGILEVKRRFSPAPELLLLVPRSRAEHLVRRIRDATAGRAVIECTGATGGG